MRHAMMLSGLLLCVPIIAVAQQTNGRLKVARADELPRHSYPFSKTVVALFEDSAQCAALAHRFEQV